jgi:hypothetical protein
MLDQVKLQQQAAIIAAAQQEITIAAAVAASTHRQLRYCCATHAGKQKVVSNHSHSALL